jgi:hypothetical protein
MRKAEEYLDEDATLTPANIDYIKEQLKKHLKEVDKHERRCSGYITLKDKIKMQKL